MTRSGGLASSSSSVPWPCSVATTKSASTCRPSSCRWSRSWRRRR